MTRAAVNLHNYCLKTFKAEAKLSLNQFQAELSVNDNGLEEERLDNQNRCFTYVAKMQIIGKFYIAVTRHAFKQYSCDWLGSIHNGYVLQSKSLNDAFENFDTQNVSKLFTTATKSKMRWKRRGYHLKEVKICILVQQYLRF